MGLNPRLAASAISLEKEVRAAAFEIIEQSGDYQEARNLLQIAEDVGLLAQRLGGPAAPPSRETTAVTPPKAKRATPGSSTVRGRYPVFFIEGDRLIKIGKGKQRTAKPYRHEATRETFDAVVQWISGKVTSGSQPFKAAAAKEDLRADFPSYQVYLIIAALHQIGVLTAGNRGQYSVDGAASVSAAQWWTALERLPQPEQEG
ncbi:MAG: hypothetical protein Kow0067_12690 [Coriobacteriia bacterium]